MFVLCVILLYNHNKHSINKLLRREIINMNADKSKITAERIRDLRIKKGLTIERLAQMMGVSKGTISKWENGYVDTIKQDKIIQLAKAFGVSPTYIMGYDDEPLKMDNGKELPEHLKRYAEFINLYSQLGEDEQSLVDNMITTLLKKQ